MLICGLDVETTGLDFDKDYITEIGVVLYDVADEGWVLKKTISPLLYDNSYPLLSPEIQKLTGINDLLLKDKGIDPCAAFKQAASLLCVADYIIAHNEEFDRKMLKSNLERYGIDDFTQDKKWLCSIKDVEYPDSVSCRKLSHIAVDLCIDFKPSELHRAFDDVILMGRVLDKLKLTPESIYQYQQEPWVYLEAQTEKPWLDGGKSKDAAKLAGYSWQKVMGDDKTFDKRWVKKIKESKLEEYKEKEYSFKRTILEV